MTNEELLRYGKEYLHELETYCNCRPNGLHVNFVRESIKALEQENQWIPVSERLPEKEGDCEYLVTTESGLRILSFAKDLCKVDEYDFWDKKGVSGWFDYDSEFGYIEVDGVIAWMPLPLPYKESEE